MGFDNSLATFCTLMTSTRTITSISSPTSQSSGGPLASADSTGQERPETLGGIDMNGYKANIAAVLSSSGRPLVSAERHAGSTGRHRNPRGPVHRRRTVCQNCARGGSRQSHEKHYMQKREITRNLLPFDCRYSSICELTTCTDLWLHSLPAARKRFKTELNWNSSLSSTTARESAGMVAGCWGVNP